MVRVAPGLCGLTHAKDECPRPQHLVCTDEIKWGSEETKTTLKCAHPNMNGQETLNNYFS